jgi:hypothetical protein
MPILATHPRACLPLILRTSALALLFLLQFEALEIALRSYYDSTNIPHSVWAPISGSARFLFSFLFVFLAAFLIIAGPRLRQHGARFVEASGPHYWMRGTAAQVLAYCGFVFVTFLLSTRSTELGHLTPVVLLVWGLLLLSTAVLALLALAPASYWRTLVQTEKGSLVIALIAGLATFLVTNVLIKSWPDMVDVTLRFSESLLHLLYSDVVSDPETSVLGTSRFKVAGSPFSTCTVAVSVGYRGHVDIQQSANCTAGRDRDLLFARNCHCWISLQCRLDSIHFSRDRVDRYHAPGAFLHRKPAHPDTSVRLIIQACQRPAGSVYHFTGIYPHYSGGFQRV